MIGRAFAAEPARARLLYSARDPKGTCVSEADFRGQVASRLGYDPFQDDATWVFNIRIDARPARPRAEIATERENKPAGRRTLEDASCEALSQTVASAVAIALDPLAGSAERRERAPAPPPASAPPPTAPPAAPPPPTTAPASAFAPAPASSAPVVPFVFVDATGAFGRTAGFAVGVRAGGGIAYRALSIALEARAEATPGPERITPLDRTSWSVFAGGLAICGHKNVLELCAVGAVGSLQAKAEDVSRPSLKGTVFGLIGGRMGVLVPVTDDIGIRANGELGIPLVRTTFNIDGKPAWTAPAVQGTIGLGVEVSFR